LKQDFRELELLNEITRLRWEGKLEAGVGGNTRSTLLKSYIKVYGHKKCPDMVHKALSWGKPGEEQLTIDYDDDPKFVWKNVDKTATDVKKDGDSNTVQTNQKTNQSTGQKRKRDELENGPHTQGSIWNQRTQTCAYDSILAILSNVYFHNAHHWRESMGSVNTLLEDLVQEW
ncbi:hypothetical protein PENSPDRAFT_554663, partial [Peniophora sp. CONT]